MKNIIETLQDLIDEGEVLAPQGGGFDGYNGNLQSEYLAWRTQALAVLRKLATDYGLESAVRDIENTSRSRYFYSSSTENILGILKGALRVVEQESGTDNRQPLRRVNTQATSKKVFVVHGHDEALKLQVARCLERLGFDAVILSERPSRGNTIIEKLEEHSDVCFAVILLTPDDVGRSVSGHQDDLKPRARQNVILELGYFLAFLGRSKVAVLYDESVETPSDYHGVEYILRDCNEAWKLRLAQELRAAGLTVDLNNL